MRSSRQAQHNFVTPRPPCGLNNVSPHYLVKLISVRDPNSHSLRLDDDYFIIKKLPALYLEK